MTINKEDVESAVETISTCSYENGKSLGIRLAADKVLDMAGEEFKKGNDKTSRILRELHKELIKYAQEADEKWKKNFYEASSFSWDVVNSFMNE